MSRTRRSLASLLSLGALALPWRAEAQLPAAATLDARARLRLVRPTIPASDVRGRLALDRTLERLDDLGVDFALPRLILVNIATAELIALEGGREVMRSRVIVGAERTRTPQLATFVTSVRTNPPWYVPASIEPEVRAKGISGFRVVNGRLVQPPGPANPLGPVRIGLLDSDGIFLHGTTSPALFARQGRALSHGCVRVERIRELGAWIRDVTPATMQTLLATGRTFELPPTQEVQVVLAYLTAWPDAAGRVMLHADPYGLDAPGARRAGFRKVARPVAPVPPEPEGQAMPGDDPL